MLRLRLQLVALAMIATSASAVAAAQAPPTEQGRLMRVAYRGELIDDENRPISGVFPLTFRLYRSAGAESPVWSEQQFVAVSEGLYEVRLGRAVGIPSAWAGEQRVLEVALPDGAAISSQTIVLSEWTPERATPLPTIRSMRFAGLAGRALRADEASTASDCNRLSGQAPSSLDHYEELRTQLDEVRARIERPAGLRVGGETTVLPRIGGEGGNRYERNCPPGFVMTGARGGAGNLIDGFRIICTQLE